MRKHTPVMLQEVIDGLPDGCSVFLDGTMGHAGHTMGVLDHVGKDVRIVGVDRDAAMLEKAQHFLAEAEYTKQVQLVQGSYADIEHIKTQADINHVDVILIDIGVNMDHFKEGDRGFSIKRDGPLDMRYDRTNGLTATQLLERMSYDELLLMREKRTDFSEKMYTGFTKDFMQARKQKPFTTTQDLSIRAKNIGINDKKLAVIFQAIRIETNNELEELEKFLQLFPDLLISTGRCMVMTYHSIEDRLVKYAFKQLVTDGVGTLVNKKVIVPHRQEVKRNKAARSAKLRIFQKA